MMSAPIAGMIAALAAVSATPAMACRAPPDENEMIREGQFKTVALARVTQTQSVPVRADFKEFHKYNWIGAVHVERVLRGSTKIRRAKIGNSAGPGSCRFTEMPKVGDLWVLYIDADEVSLRFPISLVRTADPSLSNRLPRAERH